MQIIAVDNNLQDLEALRRIVQDTFPEGDVATFTDPLMAIKYCMEHPPDVVLSERNLKRLDGFTLIKTLRQKFPNFEAAILSEDRQWLRDAENLMLGFVERPVTTKKLKAWRRLIEENKH